MKKYYGVLCVLFVLFITACGESEKHMAISNGATVLVLGDSLSYGTGAKQDEDYPTLLAKVTGWKVINKGIPGDTTAGGLERLPDLLTEYQPQLLIVELGGNDFLRQVPKDQIENNLKAILSLAKAQNVKPVLVAIPEFNALRAAVGNLADHPLYEALAKEAGVPLIADVFSDVLSDSALKADQIHPNAIGYVKVNEQLYKSLKKLGFAS